MQPIIDRNPSTGEVLAEIPGATLSEIQGAVATARQAQGGWAQLSPADRAQKLQGMVASLEKREGKIARAITQEMGKTFAAATGEVKGYTGGVSAQVEEVCKAMQPDDFSTDKMQTQVVRAPHGVVAAITPWNFPLGMPLSILIPALGAGNSVVFKPSEHVPLTGVLIFDAIAENVPAGVITLVQGAGDVGAALVESDVDMIGFVGSRDTGKRIMSSAAGELKRLVLELGGKDPVIVFADSDLEAAAECVTGGSLRNTGQVCCSVERVFVEASVSDKFESMVLEKAKAWKHGDGFEENVNMGPLVSVEQRDKVAAQVTEAVRDGARLLLGGQTPEGPGAFYPATVLAGVDPSLRVARDETFGPVVSLSTFNGEEAEAIRLGNDTPYGLGASVWSGDVERGRRVAGALQAGQVGVNRYLAGAAGTPWVGARQSGFGFLGGIEGHRQFATPKTLSVPV
ncbi:MAG: aldehyde dehydrogenase [bacterium]|nr:aldehyde dehydrogenase [bacterium]